MRIHKLLEHVGIRHEPLPHEPEPLGGRLRVIRRIIHGRRDNQRVAQRIGHRHEAVHQRGVSQGIGRQRLSAVTIYGRHQIQVLPRRQIVRFPHEKCRRFVDPVPHGKRRLTVHRLLPQRPGNQQRPQRLFPVGRSVFLAQMETHPAVPHHRPEKPSQFLGSRIMPARHILTDINVKGPRGHRRLSFEIPISHI